MPHVVQTEALVAEGILTPDQGDIIASRSRQVMVSLAINAVLCGGIIAAALGFVVWLGNAFAVALVGGLFLAGGAWVLLRASDLYRMLGNAAALIGAGMLTFGAIVDLVDKLGENTGGIVLIALGAVALAAAITIFRRSPPQAKFLTASLVLMAGAMHLSGVYFCAEKPFLSALPLFVLHGYTAAVIFSAGLLIDVRFISALAIAPFAQMLETGGLYWNAAYVFYSPETTLSIVQMGLAMAICVAVSGVLTDRFRRHTHMFGIMAFIVANLCFLVGSIWGDTVGQTIWGPGTSSWRYEGSYDDFQTAVEAFEARTLVISEHLYSVIWAVLLIVAAFWASHTNRRGVFNTAITFGAIHAYTQAFESFYDEPLAYVVGGLAAIPLAWGMWRLNARFEARSVGVEPS